MFVSEFIGGKQGFFMEKKMKDNKIIGIIGGMGPYASAYFYKLLLDKSRDFYGAKKNNDYPEILVDSVPIPDFISDTKNLEKAREILTERVKKMNDYGVSVIGMTCNTAHILLEDLAKVSNAEFISMIDAVSEKISDLGFKKVGLLATQTTISQGLYHRALTGLGISCDSLNLRTQKLHEKIIRKVIAGKSVEIERLVSQVKKFIKEENLEGLILGCTELPLVFPKEKFVNVIDCLDVLVNKLLKKYYNQ
ncbi:hypothetical protein COV89_02200 [Candidatus Shapirobacteria bacterium CG11_big_fil_rev_8_21_14_0_20_40_12]|uniref:Aspartate racemase n=3 Tax=Candidatus Shapironibacteriota TaxID=1752721 RepID=A0A2M8EVM4_9BACT|nr:MAG: hypothetical protein COV89_02200 [Candidatus Shapirobacteria bacterium CG11_big_fil_rev_8_21_14_0_20_40_12]PJC29170.1 MAG: hypothetical protein CO053_00725 [Candidatus Shapirobacteria bacterium CG_4_9_14_0_2_um_filter_40_11]PJC77109.1 MAG: hypothetical protein CO010_00985 [Candidatus Shapirobacteria bacterium CG_4_8_14_3_um_filter_39_11]